MRLTGGVGPVELVTSAEALDEGMVVGRLAEMTEGRGVFLGGEEVAKSFLL